MMVQHRINKHTSTAPSPILPWEWHLLVPWHHIHHQSLPTPKEWPSILPICLERRLRKRGMETFKILVKQCTSRDILAIKTVRKLSRWAWAYICAYYALYESKCKGDYTPTLTLPLIERLVKAFKTHRAAIYFVAGFVNGFVPMMEGVWASEGLWRGRRRHLRRRRVCGDHLGGLLFFVRDCTSTKFLIYWVYVVLRYVGSPWNQPYCTVCTVL